MTQPSLRLRFYRTLEKPHKHSRLGRLVNVLLVTLIALNILAVSLETVQELQSKYHEWFSVFEVFSVAVFSLEYLMRLWVCVEDKRFSGSRFPRLRHAFTAIALIDLLAILPFFLTLFFTVDLRSLRVLRLLRVFKLTRYSSAMNMLLEVFRKEANTLFAGFFILAVLLVLSASGAYLVEHSAQPEKFGSIPAAMWWAVSTLTTVGYGDVTPITVAGKLFGSLITIIGVGMAALPAGILASGLADQMRLDRNLLQEKLREALSNGTINSREEEQFEQLRKSLGISRSLALSIRDEFEQQQKNQALEYCPSCGHHLSLGHAAPPQEPSS